MLAGYKRFCKYTLNINLSATLYKKALVPTLIYGSKCWVWMKRYKSRLTAIEKVFLGGVFSCLRRDTVKIR